MKCEEIKEILSGYVDGEARGDEGRLVEEHLSACAMCRGLVRRMRLLGEGIEKAEGVVPPGFRDTLFARMEREGLIPRRRSLFTYSVRWAVIPVAAAAALTLFVLTSRETGKVGPDIPAAPRQAMSEPQQSAREAPERPTSMDGRSPRAQDAREPRIASQRPPQVPAAAVGAGAGGGQAVADSRAGADLTPEERDIVAYLDVLEDSAGLEEPSGIDELEMAEPAGGKNG